MLKFLLLLFKNKKKIKNQFTLCIDYETCDKNMNYNYE